MWSTLCSATEGSGKLRTAKGPLDQEAIDDLTKKGFDEVMRQTSTKVTNPSQ